MFDYNRYEREKQALQAKELTPHEYEAAIQNLEKLCAAGKTKTRQCHGILLNLGCRATSE